MALLRISLFSKVDGGYKQDHFELLPPFQTTLDSEDVAESAATLEGLQTLLAECWPGKSGHFQVYAFEAGLDNPASAILSAGAYKRLMKRWLANSLDMSVYVKEMATKKGALSLVTASAPAMDFAAAAAAASAMAPAAAYAAPTPAGKETSSTGRSKTRDRALSAQQMAHTRSRVSKVIGKAGKELPFPGRPGENTWEFVVVSNSALHPGNLRANHTVITSGDDLPDDAFDATGALRAKRLYARCRVEGCHAARTTSQAVRAISHSTHSLSNLINHQNDTPRFHPTETAGELEARSATTCALAAAVAQQRSSEAAPAMPAASDSVVSASVVSSESAASSAASTASSKRKASVLVVAEGRKKEEVGVVMCKVGDLVIKAHHVASSRFLDGACVHDALVNALVLAECLGAEVDPTILKCTYRPLSSPRTRAGSALYRLMRLFLIYPGLESGFLTVVVSSGIAVAGENSEPRAEASSSAGKAKKQRLASTPESRRKQDLERTPLPSCKQTNQINQL